MADTPTVRDFRIMGSGLTPFFLNIFPTLKKGYWEAAEKGKRIIREREAK